jgi:hypothetical protein
VRESDEKEREREREQKGEKGNSILKLFVTE